MEGESGHTRENTVRQLEYTDDFKEFIGQNPGVLKSAFETIQKGFDGDSIDVGRVKIEKKEFGGERASEFYLVDVAGKKLFVKKLRTELVEKASGYRADGFQEVTASREAEERLAEIPWARVIDYKLGYKHGDQSFFVSEWNEALTHDLAELLRSLRREIYEQDSPQAKAKYELLIGKIAELFDILGDDFFDVERHNMAYDETNDQVILFDLMKYGDYKGPRIAKQLKQWTLGLEKDDYAI